MATIRLFPIEVSEMVFGTLLLHFSVPRVKWYKQTFKLGLVYVKGVKVQQLDYFLSQICPETDFGGLLR